MEGEREKVGGRTRGEGEWHGRRVEGLMVEWRGWEGKWEGCTEKLHDPFTLLFILL